MLAPHWPALAPHSLALTPPRPHPLHVSTEDYDFIQYTVVVKLTPDAAGEAPSAMRVVGAPGGTLFYYGPEAGASGCFRAALYHASVAPVSPEEHLKLAFFFRASTKGERRVKRALSETGASGSETARQRKHVTAELGAASVAACSELPLR